MVIKIGVISDTHYPERVPYLPYDELSQIFAGCDAILHSGDIETMGVLDELEKIAPVYAVRGDDEIDTHNLPLKRVIDIAGVRIGLHHGERPFHVEFANKLAKQLRIQKSIDWHNVNQWLVDTFADDNVDAIVFGHFHIPYTAYHDGKLLFSAGSVYTLSKAAARWRSQHASHWFRRLTSRIEVHIASANPPLPTVGILNINDDKTLSTSHIELKTIKYAP